MAFRSARIALLFLSVLFVSSGSFATEVPSPAAAGSQHPHLATLPDGRVVMTWFEPAGDKKTALRLATFEKTKWSAPVTIAAREDFFLNWADFPSVVADEKGVLYAHWLQKSGASTYAYDVYVTTSADGGATWRPARVLHNDGTQGEHGFVSLVPLEGGGAGALWLDGREMKGEEGDMGLRYASIAADGTIGKESVLDARVCECCTTGMARTRDGMIAVYRDRTDDETRDISVVRLAGGKWTKPVPLWADGWKIDGCPVNGPQVDARGKHVVVAWFTAAGDKQKVKVAFSGSGGEIFTTPIVLSGAAPVGRVDVLLCEDNTALVTWIEGLGEKAEIVARRVARGGWTGAVMKVATTSSARSAGFPRTTLAGNDAWFAWTEPSSPKKIRVTRIAMQ